MNIDDYVGHLGWYQIFLYLVVAYVQVPSGANAVISVFLLADVDYRCRTCFDDQVNLAKINGKEFETTEESVNRTEYETFLEENFFVKNEDKRGSEVCGFVIDRCQADVNVLASGLENENENGQNTNNFELERDELISKCCQYPISNNSNVLETTCTNEIWSEISANNYSSYTSCDKFVYSHENYESTVKSEFDLVCQKSWLADLATSMYYAGFGFGGVVAGYICDKYGRKPVLLSFAVGTLATNIWSSFSGDEYMFIVTRFFMGFFVNGWLIAGYTMAVEFTGSKYRSYLTMFFQALFALGELLLSLFAISLTNWRDLQLAVGLWVVPLFIFVPFLIPESYRWYMAKNRPKEAVEVATKIMAKNRNRPKICGGHGEKTILTTEEKEHLSNEIIEQIENNRKAAETAGDKSASFSDLFTNPNIRKITLNLMYNWFVNSMVYYGLALNAGSLPGSDIFNNSINAIMEWPAYIIFPFCIDSKLLGRKGTLGCFLIFGGLCCLASTIALEFQTCEEGDIFETTGQIFAYLGKFALSGTFALDYTYSGEIYPSEIRSVGLSVCSFAARVSGVLSPFVLSLAGLASWLPGSIFSVLGVSAGLLTFLLPETNGNPLLTTVKETEEVYFSKKK